MHPPKRDTFHHGDVRSKFGAQDRCQILITVGISEHAFGRGGHPVGKAIDFDTSSMGYPVENVANNFPLVPILVVVSKNFSGLYLNQAFCIKKKKRTKKPVVSWNCVGNLVCWILG